MKEVLVLGAGLIGKTVAEELSKDFSVTVIDKSNKDFSAKELNNCAKVLGTFDSICMDKYSLVVGCLPGKLGYAAAKKVIENGKDYIDISFAPEDLKELDELAKKNNVKCIYDFGLAPGLSHILYGYHSTDYGGDKIAKYHIYVGGLTKFPEPPLYYKSTFSPADVYEEYTRPARFIYDGKILTKPALSDLEIIQFNNSYYEAFLTDGVRSLLKNTSTKEIIEKTIRQPGHVHGILSLINNKEKLLAVLENSKIGPNDIDETLMKIYVEFKNGHFLNITLHDNHDGEKSSMARTTGFTCAAGASLLINNIWGDTGVFAPEEIGKNLKCFGYLIRYLSDRSIIFKWGIDKNV